MPAITLHPPTKPHTQADSSLPKLLQTPAGLAIVEIQGTVNTQNTTKEDRSIGQLQFPNYDPSKPAEDTSWHKRVYLYVGRHQRMTGEVKKLAKPIAVVRRRTSTENDGADGDELEVAEIVYYKLLFTHRPEPVGGGGG